MRHRNAGNKLGTNGPHRKAILRGLTLAILEHDSIHTTRARAKEMRWWADHAVTLAKKGDLSARRQLVKLLGSTETFRTGENRVRNAITRLYTEIAPRFKDRSGGYTQIIRLARPRAGDCADMCIMRYIPSVSESKKSSKQGVPAKDKKTKTALASKVTEAKASPEAPSHKAEKRTSRTAEDSGSAKKKPKIDKVS